MVLAAGFHDQRNQQNHQHNHIEVGSEILVSDGACLTDDNVRQKLDSGAILVHGKEELPLDYDATIEDNNRKRRPYSAGHILNHDHLNDLATDEKEYRRLSDDEVIRVKQVNSRPRLRSTGSDHEGYIIANGAHNNSNNEQIKDKNANARVTHVNGEAITRRQSATLPRSRRRRALSSSFMGNPLPPHRVTPDGTAIYYWCELPRRPGSQGKFSLSLNPKTNSISKRKVIQKLSFLLIAYVM